MSEYRDALTSAKERVARLEALAKERGLPQKSNAGRNVALGAVGVILASAGIFLGVHEGRERHPVTEYVIVDRSATPPSAPNPPRDLEWYEPADSWNPIRGRKKRGSIGSTSSSVCSGIDGCGRMRYVKLEGPPTSR